MAHVAKVPMIMQMEATECGAACLSMIFAYHGKWIPLERIREDCGVSRDGSVAQNILVAARSYGMESKGYKIEIEGIKRIPYPCIIHWNFCHYVVLCGFRRNGNAVLNDPARGIVEVTAEEFDRSYTGIVLLFNPTEAFEKSGSPHSVIKFLRSRLTGTLSPFLFVMLTGLVVTFIYLVNPVFSRVFIDQILPGKTSEWLYPMLGIMSGIVLIYTIVSLLNAIYLIRIQGKMAITANADFFWHVIRLPVSFFSQRYAGDLLNRQLSNESISKTAIERLAPACISALMLLFFFPIMVCANWGLALISLTGVLVNVLMFRWISLKRLNLLRAQMRDQGRLESLTTSGIEMIETLKTSGAEDGYFARWAGLYANLNNLEVKMVRLNSYFGSIPILIHSLTNGIILMIGVWLIIQNHFTIGSLLAFQGFVASFSVPVLSLSTLGQQMQEMRGALERIEDVMQFEPDIKYNTPTQEAQQEPRKKLDGEVEIRSLTFGYNRLGKAIIKNFSLTVMPGQRIAIVGESGCGKSTVAKLVSGLYQPWSGEILFDGRPLHSIPHEIVNGSLGVVDQDTTIFESSIADNIRMWDRSIEDFEVILAAKDAQLHEEIMMRDGGYNSQLSEGGKNFSGGQRQRLEIARALAQDPVILILDEATSALDSITEKRIVESIHDRGITCIIVAHKLSTIRDCDLIVVMQNGEIVDRGTHEELIMRNGVYKSLIEIQ